MYICISVFDLVEYLAVSSEQGPIASGQMCIGHQHPNLNISTSFTNYYRNTNIKVHKYTNTDVYWSPTS